MFHHLRLDMHSPTIPHCADFGANCFFWIFLWKLRCKIKNTILVSRDTHMGMCSPLISLQAVSIAGDSLCGEDWGSEKCFALEALGRVRMVFFFSTLENSFFLSVLVDFASDL